MLNLPLQTDGRLVTVVAEDTSNYTHLLCAIRTVLCPIPLSQINNIIIYHIVAKNTKNIYLFTLKVIYFGGDGSARPGAGPENFF